jgi:hypothetical protein
MADVIDVERLPLFGLPIRSFAPVTLYLPTSFLECEKSPMKTSQIVRRQIRGWLIGKRR